MSEMIRAVSYARVSTKYPNQRPETQHAMNGHYAMDHNMVVVKEFTDRISGNKRSRKGFSEMLDYIGGMRETDPISVILITDPDRLTRNTDHLRPLVDEISHAGCRLVFVLHDTLDTNTEEGMQQVLCNVYLQQLDRECKKYASKIGQIIYLSGVDPRVPPDFDSFEKPRKFTDAILACADAGYTLNQIHEISKKYNNPISSKYMSDKLKEEGRMNEYLIRVHEGM